MIKCNIRKHRPDPHWCRLHSLVSDERPAHALPPPNSLTATVRNLACEPTPHGLLHSAHSLKSVHWQSAEPTTSSGSFSNLFLRGIFRMTNRLSRGSGVSLIFTFGDLSGFEERERNGCRGEVIGRWKKKKFRCQKVSWRQFSVTRWWNKKLPKCCPKSGQINFYMKVELCEIAQKFTRIFGLLL